MVMPPMHTHTHTRMMYLANVTIRNLDIEPHEDHSSKCNLILSRVFMVPCHCDMHISFCASEEGLCFSTFDSMVDECARTFALQLLPRGQQPRENNARSASARYSIT
jgi:hypothetical protein